MSATGLSLVLKGTAGDVQCALIKQMLAPLYELGYVEIPIQCQMNIRTVSDLPVPAGIVHKLEPGGLLKVAYTKGQQLISVIEGGHGHSFSELVLLSGSGTKAFSDRLSSACNSKIRVGDISMMKRTPYPGPLPKGCVGSEMIFTISYKGLSTVGVARNIISELSQIGSIDHPQDERGEMIRLGQVQIVAL